MIVFFVVTIFPISLTIFYLNLLLSQFLGFIVKGCVCCSSTFSTFSTNVMHLEKVRTLSTKLCLLFLVEPVF